MVFKAYGKINLGLDVLRRREDGYHDVRMIMQMVGLYDVLTMEKIPEDKIHMTCNLFFLPTDEKNLVYRAIAMIKEKYQITSGVKIDLNKRIPVAAGMAGGSSDCATAIKGMNELFDLQLSEEEMCEIGVQLGADVPYCIMGGTALAEGIGEKLKKLPPMPECYILIAKPGISVSTGFVYTNLKLDQDIIHPDIDGMLMDIEKKDLMGLCDKLSNVLETVTEPNYPIITQVKEFLIKEGAMGSLMSGSGPTIFGIFDNKKTANKALQHMKKMKEIKQAYVVEPVQ